LERASIRFAWCQALLAAGDLDRHLGRHDEQHKHYQECLAIARETGDQRTLARVLPRLATVFGMPGGLAMQRRYSEEAVTLSRELGDKPLLHFSLNSLGTLLVAAGELNLVEPLYTESLMLCRDCGDREGIVVSLLNLVVLSLQLGSLQDTRKRMLEALAIAQQTSSKRSELIVLGTAAQLAAYLCDWARAARLYGACVAHAEETRLPIEIEGPDKGKPERVREALGSAAFTAAAEGGRLLGSKASVAEARAWLEESRAQELS
jgi:tetratricopeptide (TPR) repeat protein